ncbi:hypothetical protein BHM03_00013368 [Ensete ventricosum]|nr:hypothetical protein BHM03_00013368 [Ensete ventricosum]
MDLSSLREMPKMSTEKSTLTTRATSSPPEVEEVCMDAMSKRPVEKSVSQRQCSRGKSCIPNQRRSCMLFRPKRSWGKLQIRLCTSQGSDLIDEGAFEKLYKGTYNGEDVAIKLLERAQLMEQQFVQEYAKAVLDEEGRIDKSTKIADFGVVLMEVKTEGMTLETRTYRWMAPAYCGPAQLTMASPTQWATEVVGLAPTQ